ncbi:molybdopterin-dependent oxidoreductase [Iodidimonas sp. SYSU 1G8]|uniref:molybdopterin-containing oxidoreductase family protein n=1 Tax=Iodidimonas sp. SYSU 1G8 TaxID=3133967 RepID=UPI0031FECE93
MAETHTAICRFCHSFCGIKVTIEDGKVAKVIGDKDNPMYFGYSCVKGRQLPQQHYNPERLLHPHKKVGGHHETVTSGEALDDIAATLSDLIARHGPRSVALYTGTYAFPYPASSALAGAFMQAIGSRMKFSSGSIDQPGKPLAIALHGRWNAGPQPFSESDTWMLVGANPVVSKWGGIPQYNPAKRLHEALKRGMKLIVIDPRRTEAAEKAHIHLQCKPGEDPTILAGIANLIIEEGLFDRDFIEQEVDGFEALRQAVAPFTPDYVARRADVPRDLLIEAARTYARSTRGMTTAGTGPNMAPRGTLTEYLVLVINTLCGRWLREGEKMPNPFVLIPERRGKAQAEPKPQGWGYGEKLRVRDLGDNAGGLTAAALADEILLEGEGQVKALISVGGNPMAAWPDQLKTYEAMKALALNVTLDIKMSATAKLADYVIPSKLGLETPAMSQPNEFIWFYGFSTGYPEPYAMYQPKLIDPPAGSDLIEEWEFFYGLAQRMGLQLVLAGEPLDMVNKPTTDELFELLAKGSRIPLDEVKKYEHGHIFDDPSITVLAKDADCAEKLDIGNVHMMDELREVIAEPVTDHAGYTAMHFTHRLVSRRMHDVYNSSGRDIPALVRNHSYNPAFMNPGDIAALGLNAGDVVKISSDHASILGIIEEAPDVKPGVISMAHSFGDAPEFDNQVFFIGSNTGRLTNVEKDYDPRTGMPRMSAIPVNLTRVDQNIAAQ